MPATRPARGPVMWPHAPTHGLTLWFTGLSGAGKSTLTVALAKRLRGVGMPTVVLDADVLRLSLCAGLGFSRADRAENVRRIAEVAARLTASRTVVLVACIAPYRELRAMAREKIGRFVEVYVSARLDTCVRRDPKGLYVRAMSGELPCFTGVSDPYEEPLAPEIEVCTDSMTVEACTAMLFTSVMAPLNAPVQYAGGEAGG